jgi:hypothetical protein
MWNLKTWALWSLSKNLKLLKCEIFTNWNGSKYWEAGYLRRSLIFRKSAIKLCDLSYAGNVVWPWRFSLVLGETVRGPMTLMDGLRSGDDHSDERCGDEWPYITIVLVNNHPKSDAATNDPKEQRSWSELSPQITMTGPADPKEQRSWSGWP